MHSRTWIFLIGVLALALGGGWYYYNQQPEASSTGYTYYCRNADTKTGYPDTSLPFDNSVKPPKASGTFSQDAEKPLTWTWNYPGVTYEEPRAKRNGAVGNYEETLVGYKVSVWMYRSIAGEDRIIEQATVTTPTFSTKGLGNRTAEGGNAWDTYKLSYEAICRTNDADTSDNVTYSASSDRSNEITAVYTYNTATSSSSTSSTEASSGSSTSSSTSSSVTSDSTSTNTQPSSNTETTSNPESSADTESTPTTQSTTSTSSKSTSKKSSAAPSTTATEESTTSQLYSVAWDGLPTDTITDFKQLTTLPGASTTLAIKPGKATKSVTVMLDGQTTEATKTAATGEYSAAVTAPSTAGKATATINVTYEDGTTEEFQVVVDVVPNGVASDTTGSPVAGATITLQKQSTTGMFETWDPAETGQQNPVTTGSTGTYGFVVEAGTYQVVATTADGVEVLSDVVVVGPMNGPVAPNLTLVAAATETTTSTGLPWWIWVAAAAVLLGLGAWLLMRKQGGGPSNPPTQSRPTHQPPVPPTV